MRTSSAQQLNLQSASSLENSWLCLGPTLGLKISIRISDFHHDKEDILELLSFMGHMLATARVGWKTHSILSLEADEILDMVRPMSGYNAPGL